MQDVRGRTEKETRFIRCIGLKDVHYRITPVISSSKDPRLPLSFLFLGQAFLSHKEGIRREPLAVLAVLVCFYVRSFSSFLTAAGLV